jgi:hypothetical protein
MPKVRIARSCRGVPENTALGLQLNCTEIYSEAVFIPLFRTKLNQLSNIRETWTTCEADKVDRVC